MQNAVPHARQNDAETHTFKSHQTNRRHTQPTNHSTNQQDLTDLQPRDRMAFWDTRFAELVALPQVLVTPHTAFLTVEALTNIAQTTVANLDQVRARRRLWVPLLCWFCTAAAVCFCVCLVLCGHRAFR